MKKLIHDSKNYTDTITTAIATCYADEKPTNSQLMSLYATIGEQIALQGEIAFVAHIAEVIKVEFPNLSGYSLRNLRRMRDFYLTYKDESALLAKTFNLSWTQNSVIMECCDTNEQRTFYIQLAMDQNLSKLKLIAAIENGEYEIAQTIENASEAVSPVVDPVSDFISEETHDTCTTTKAKRVPFVKPCAEVVEILWIPNVINTIFHRLE